MHTIALGHIESPALDGLREAPGARPGIALGVDVSLSRGLDAVVLDTTGRVLLAPVKTGPAGLADLIADVRPAVVAIDSPPAWARSGRSRAAERQLLALGVSIFATPADPGDHPFYRWMRAGFEVFAAAAAAGCPLYRGERLALPAAIEVFPHATAVLLNGGLPPAGTGKIAWRRRALRQAGVDDASLRTLDQVDAALAALTGVHLLSGTACFVGEPGEAVLVLPGRAVPASRFRRGGSDPGVGVASPPARVYGSPSPRR